MCAKVGKPDKSSAAALAHFFGNAGPSHKRSFDPNAECVVAPQHAEKATNQKMKNETFSVVFLKEKPSVVPKGHSRA